MRVLVLVTTNTVYYYCSNSLKTTFFPLRTSLITNEHKIVDYYCFKEMFTTYMCIDARINNLLSLPAKKYVSHNLRERIARLIFIEEEEASKYF